MFLRDMDFSTERRGEALRNETNSTTWIKSLPRSPTRALLLFEPGIHDIRHSETLYFQLGGGKGRPQVENFTISRSERHLRLFHDVIRYTVKKSATLRCAIRTTSFSNLVVD